MASIYYIYWPSSVLMLSVLFIRYNIAYQQTSSAIIIYLYFHKPRCGLVEHLVGWVSGLDAHTQEGSKQRVAA